MSTYTQILYHLVFGTKHHHATLDLDRHEELYRYIAGTLQNKNCVPYRVGGYTEHVHVLFSLHPSLALADTVKDIKLATSKWIKDHTIFPAFEGWQEGYGAFTCSWSVKPEVEKYIAHQIEHHHQRSFRDEFVDMLERAGIEYDERYLI